MGAVNGYLEIFAALIIIMLLVSIQNVNTKEPIDKRLSAMIYCHLLVLLLDATRWILSQRTDVGVLMIVLSAAPTIISLIGHAYTASFAVELLSQKGPVPRKAYLSLIALFVFSVLIWTIFVMINGVHSAANMQTNYRDMLFSWGYWLGHLNWAAACVVGIWLVFRCKSELTRAEQLSLSSYCAFPIVALVLRFFWDGAQIFLSTSLAIMWISVIAYREQRQRLSEKETQLAQSRMAIVLSRVQPEYFDEILKMICALCDENAQNAKKLIEQFADFLRYNLEAANLCTPISFKDELLHTKVYLEIERQRHKGKLNVTYNIDVMSFNIPSLTMQPVVENAIMQSIKSANGSFQINITTETLPDFYEIKITYWVFDTGDDVKLNEKGLVDSMLNVKARLWLMCNATLNLMGADNGETTAIIAIPKSKKM